MRILFIANFQFRKDGGVGGYTGSTQKLFNGLVRSGHNVYLFSDRDFIYFNAPLGIRDLGKKQLNKSLLTTAKAFNPELIIISHCELIKDSTLLSLRQATPNTPIVHWNIDAIFIDNNIKRLRHYYSLCDYTFITTSKLAVKEILGDSGRIRFIPNIIDPSIEVHDASKQTDHSHDLIFCGRNDNSSTRHATLTRLNNVLKNEINFSIYGNFYGYNNYIWGNDYYQLLSQSKMGLCLNYKEGYKLYASDRLAQFVGSGLLTFIHKSSCYDELLPEKTLVYYSNIDDLIEKIRHFNANDIDRTLWASTARNYFHKHFCDNKIAQYIVEESCGLSHSNEYSWHDK